MHVLSSVSVYVVRKAVLSEKLKYLLSTQVGETSVNTIRKYFAAERD